MQISANVQKIIDIAVEEMFESTQVLSAAEDIENGTIKDDNPYKDFEPQDLYEAARLLDEGYGIGDERDWF